MTEELENKIREILKQNKVKPELWNIRTMMAMESAYRQGYINAMQEMSRDSDTQEQYDSSHKPCDKVSHDCHIEYDNVSHGSCFDCVHCEQGQELDGSESLFCHHDDVKDGKELPVSDCPLWEKDNGSVLR